MPSEKSIRPDPCDSWPYPPANRPESANYLTAFLSPTNLLSPNDCRDSRPSKLSCRSPVGKSEYRNVS